jgi:hypothetical protein
VKWVDTLTVNFDGNRVTVEGPYFHVRRLLRTLRRYEQADRGASAVSGPALRSAPVRQEVAAGFVPLNSAIAVWRVWTRRVIEIDEGTFL